VKPDARQSNLWEKKLKAQSRVGGHPPTVLRSAIRIVISPRSLAVVMYDLASRDQFSSYMFLPARHRWRGFEVSSVRRPKGKSLGS